MTHIFQAHVPPVGDPLFDARLRGTLIGEMSVKLTLVANHVEEDYPFDLVGVGKNGDDIRLVIDFESHVKRW